LPRKKIPADLRSLARGHTELCIKVLAGLVSQEAVPPAARVSAAGILLDRGWGRAPQAHPDEDNKDVRITIRNITESRTNGACGGTPRVSTSSLVFCQVFSRGDPPIASRAVMWQRRTDIGHQCGQAVPRQPLIVQELPFSISTRAFSARR
jgi:hypothetical protein